MKIPEKLEKFLQDAENQKLLNDCNFKELYQRLSKMEESVEGKDIGNFSKLMFDIGVDPLEYMDRVPEKFLYGVLITKIVIPNHITSIGKYAFAKCKLKNIVIPNSVQTIDEGAFYEARKLTSIVIPNGVTTIGYEMFDGCEGLTKISIPSSVTHIDDYAFNECYFLSEIYFGGTIEQWNAIKKGTNWDYRMGIYVNSHIIHCIDGDFNFSPHS